MVLVVETLVLGDGAPTLLQKLKNINCVAVKTTPPITVWNLPQPLRAFFFAQMMRSWLSGPIQPMSNAALPSGLRVGKRKTGKMLKTQICGKNSMQPAKAVISIGTGSKAMQVMKVTKWQINWRTLVPIKHRLNFVSLKQRQQNRL